MASTTPISSKNMEELISQLKALPPLKQKLATALVSVIVADAAGEVIMLPCVYVHIVSMYVISMLSDKPLYNV